MNSIQFGLGHIYHSRYEGAKNRFRYPSYYLFFNCDEQDRLQTIFQRKFRGVFSFRAQDYLSNTQGDLRGCFTKFLEKNGIQYTPEELWLHTLPRLFGYAFNPVSFWFCGRKVSIDNSPVLKWDAVLVEVNNTFGERHFYWIQPENGLNEEEWYRADKKFHVSPFFPVDGYYQFRFQLNSARSRIDIFHYAPTTELRLATWVQGDHVGVSELSVPSLLVRYGWITPLVVLRIHWQALRIWLKKNRFYKKPVLPNKELSS